MRYIEAFLGYLKFERRYSEYTIRSYKIDLFQFAGFLSEDHTVGEVFKANYPEVRSWIISLMESGISPRSVNRKISSLKSYYKFLLKQGVLKQDPMSKVVSPKNKKRLPVFIEAEPLALLLDQIDLWEGYEGLRDRHMIEMLYFTGMRRSELVHLKIKNIQLSGLGIKVLGKRKLERIIPITNEFADQIRSYLEMREAFFSDKEISSDYFLTIKGNPVYPELVYRVVKKYLSLVTTVEKKSPHILRHTFATQMLNKGADINTIKELLGHANLSATQIYTHNTFEKLKEVYKQAHPRA